MQKIFLADTELFLEGMLDNNITLLFHIEFIYSQLKYFKMVVFVELF